ncbi:DUF6585 family protein [Streptomyces sp. NPDC048659]|uniref:DUF6585 family protein n=1 Tax=Streptomyces sp. NPDC048659 TaxID=3155489 RepID=UPI003419CB43
MGTGDVGTGGRATGDRVTVPPPGEEATRTARAAGLGMYLRGFRAHHREGERRRGVPPAALLLLVVAALGLPVLATRLVGAWAGVPLLVLPFGALGRLVWAYGRLPNASLRPDEYVYLYERGLLFPGRDGGARAVAWEGVTAMHQDVTRTYVHGGYAGTRYAYRLSTGGRRAVTVDGFVNEETVPKPSDSQIRELAQIVLDETVRRALPRAVTALEKGGSVAFGEVALDGLGITLPSGRSAWERVRRCELRGDGLLVVRTSGGGRWARESKEIPDFPVFWALVKELAPAAREHRR